MFIYLQNLFYFSFTIHGSLHYRIFLFYTTMRQSQGVHPSGKPGIQNHRENTGNTRQIVKGTGEIFYGACLYSISDKEVLLEQ